jgi:hypothetical protein
MTVYNVNHIFCEALKKIEFETLNSLGCKDIKINSYYSDFTNDYNTEVLFYKNFNNVYFEFDNEKFNFFEKTKTMLNIQNELNAIKAIRKKIISETLIAHLKKGVIKK